MSEIIDSIANTAFSLTLSGNSGISPFLTMFLIGVVGKAQPEYLKLDETMEKIMTSWPSICFWSAMTILESVGKCVPVIDHLLNSAETFIVPIFSTLGTVSSFGSFSSNDDDDGSASNNSEQGEANNEQDEVNDNADNGGEDGENRRLRGLSTVSTSSVAKVTGAFFRVILVIFGMVLAISIHFFKMLMRLVGEGYLTQLITVLEATTVIVSVLASIFIRQFAIFVAACLLFAAGYNTKKRYEKMQEEELLEVQEGEAKKKHGVVGFGKRVAYGIFGGAEEMKAQF